MSHRLAILLGVGAIAIVIAVVSLLVGVTIGRSNVPRSASVEASAERTGEPAGDRAVLGPSAAAKAPARTMKQAAAVRTPTSDTRSTTPPVEDAPQKLALLRSTVLAELSERKDFALAEGMDTSKLTDDDIRRLWSGMQQHKIFTAIPKERPLDFLRQVLASEDGVTEGVCLAVAKYGASAPLDATIRDRIAAALDSPDIDVATKATCVSVFLYEQGDDAVPYTQAALRHGDSEVRAAVIDGLPFKPRAVGVPALIEALSDPDADCRWRAEQGLIRISGRHYGADPLAWTGWWKRQNP